MEPDMFVIGYFLRAAATVLHYVLYTYMLIVIARALLSWVSPDPYNPIVRFLYNVTEPVLFRLRKAVPLAAGSIDFTPMLLILALVFLDQFVVPTLMRIAYMLGG
jgi:YggT family protein